MKVKKIEIGSTLGIMCPSSKFNEPKTLEIFLEYLTKKGFKYKLGKSMNESYGYLAGSDEVRADDLNGFFKDDDVDAILCFRGGYGFARFLNEIDYELISKKPKLLIGFSDVTALLNAIYKKTKVIGLHGEMGIRMKKEYLENDFYSFKNMIDTMLGVAPSNLLEGFENAVSFKNNSIIKGEIVGGNLSLVASLMGTPYEIDTKDKILLLEDVDEVPYTIDRYLCTLRLANKLKDAKALVIGYFTRCDKEPTSTNQSIKDVLEEYTKDLDCQVVYNFPTGHDQPFVNVPLGVPVEINPISKSVIVLESLFLDK